MVKLNLLTESFITNSGVSSQRVVSAQEMDGLIAQSGNVFTFSGSKVSLLMDLGYQKDVDRLKYSFTPASLSGITVKYGRTLNDLTTASPTVVGNSIEALPTQSGYTYPRYWYLLHDTPSGSPITVSGLTVLNNDTTVDFGTSGTLTSITVLPVDGVEGYSDVYEVQAFNNGSIPTDIFVSVDSYGLSSDIFNRIEIAPTATGTFKSINEELTMPDSIPWEWGDFSSNITVTSGDQLKLIDSSLFRTFALNTPIQMSNSVTTNVANDILRAKNANGQPAAVGFDNNLRLLIFDPRTDTTLTSPNPASVPADDNDRNGHGAAWDGNDRIYYMLNSTDQTIRYYTISTNTHGVLGTVSGYFSRAIRKLIYVNGDLYIAGGVSTAGTNTSIGTLFIKYNVNTLAQTSLTNLPATPNTSAAFFTYYNGYIYTQLVSSNSTFRRYNISLNAWETLASIPSTSLTALIASPERGTIMAFATANAGTMHEYNPLTGIWTTNSITGLQTGISTSANSWASLFSSNLLVGWNFTGLVPIRTVYALGALPDVNLPISISGTWLSPIFNLDNTENYHRLLIDSVLTTGAFLKADNSIGVDNFEFRGSNTSPSSDNFTEDFDEDIDPDAFVSESLNEFSAVAVSGGALTFSHDFQNSTDTPFNRAYLYFSLPITSAGKIQYKFWWNPSIKTVGTSNFSAFYLVPFLNTVDDGTVAARNPDTLRRTAADWIYIRFGQSSDTGGSYSQIAVNNGSSNTTYAITASAGTFHEVNFILDWDTGNYSLYFKGTLVGNGTIPMIQMQKMEGQHSFEFYSTGDSIDSQEQFKLLTINRIGTLAPEESNTAIPVHLQDPLFGRTGSLQWFPVTVNSGLIPKYKYVQFRLTFRASNLALTPAVNSVKFPIVLRLENVQVGSYKSFFLRYNFPVSNSINTTSAFIKAWMATDKN